MLPIPRVVVGTARLGSVLPAPLTRKSTAEVFRTLDALVEAGCSAFDLAASYQLGGTERLVGHWLASRGLRQKLFLVGKGGHPYPGLRPNRLTPALSAAVSTPACAGSGSTGSTSTCSTATSRVRR